MKKYSKKTKIAKIEIKNELKFNKNICIFANWKVIKNVAGCGTVGSALASGVRGRPFESDYPDTDLIIYTI